MVIGGDLNFILSLREFWGSHPKEDRQCGFFISFLESLNLTDMEPVNLSPTWTKLRTGRDEVVKQLDRFLVTEKFLEKGLRFISKVEEGGSSDHHPISMRWSPSPVSTPLPPSLC
jgi:hypothetical protein